MHDQPPTPEALEPVDWRQLLRFDPQAVAVLLGCLAFLVGFLAVLPRWLASRDRSDFAGVAARTVSGTVTALQISPVSSGGGSLFNAVNLSFAGHLAYYALPPQSQWKPIRGQGVLVTFRVGRRSHAVRVDAVVPGPTPLVPRDPPQRGG